MRLNLKLCGFAGIIVVLAFASSAVFLPPPSPLPTNTSARLIQISRQLQAVAAELQQAQLPTPPANAKSTNALIPPSFPANHHRIYHPSGVTFDITMPTNQFVVVIPQGMSLQSQPLSQVTLETLAELKRTNETAVIYYFVR